MPTLLPERKKQPLAVQPSISWMFATSTPPASPKAPRKSPARAAVSETPSNTGQWHSWLDGVSQKRISLQTKLAYGVRFRWCFYFLFASKEIEGDNKWHRSWGQKNCNKRGLKIWWWIFWSWSQNKSKQFLGLVPWIGSLIWGRAEFHISAIWIRSVEKNLLFI